MPASFVWLPTGELDPFHLCNPYSSPQASNLLQNQTGDFVKALVNHEISKVISGKWMS